MKRRSYFKKMLCFALMICSLSVPAASYGTALSRTEAGSGSIVSPRFIAINAFATELSISSGGLATCEGTVTVSSGHTCDATLEMQRKEGSTWRTIKTWTSSGRANSFNKSYYVVSDYSYRLKLTADVYNSNGTLVESSYIYSTVEYY